MKVAVCGAAGRMGRTIVRLICDNDGDSVVGAIESSDSPHLGKDVGELAGVGAMGVALGADIASELLSADAVIDFTHASVFDSLLRGAMRAGVPFVSGTTRLSDASRALIDTAAATIPVLWAPNMSVGVQVMARLVKQAAASLGAEYDIEVTETHHNKKADAPSGTATFLVNSAIEARPELEPVHGREGNVGARQPNEIGVHALRGGDVIGDHSVHLIGAADRIEITHRAITRDLFAHGAIRAARFVSGKPAGRYELADMLGPQ